MSLPPFQDLVDAHKDDVYRLLLAMVGRPDADDCFQDTFISALRAYPALRPDSNLRAWLHTIARRKAFDRIRARRPAATLEDHEPWLAAPGDAEAISDLWHAVSRLPEKQRLAITYRYAVGLTSAETATLAGGSDASVRQNTRDGLRKLRLVYTAEGGQA